jgi:hypothetical protein
MNAIRLDAEWRKTKTEIKGVAERDAAGMER